MATAESAASKQNSVIKKNRFERFLSPLYKLNLVIKKRHNA